jgi:hypothetical protein
VGLELQVTVTAAGALSPASASSSRTETIGVDPAPALSALKLVLRPGGPSASAGRLLRAGGYTMRFRAPYEGSLVISWYRASGWPRHKQLVAHGHAEFSSASTRLTQVRLTVAGRRLLDRPPVKLIAIDEFHPVFGPAVAVQGRFAVNRSH